MCKSHDRMEFHAGRTTVGFDVIFAERADHQIFPPLSQRQTCLSPATMLPLAWNGNRPPGFTIERLTSGGGLRCRTQQEIDGDDMNKKLVIGAALLAIGKR